MNITFLSYLSLVQTIIIYIVKVKLKRFTIFSEDFGCEYRSDFIRSFSIIIFRTMLFFAQKKFHDAVESVPTWTSRSVILMLSECQKAQKKTLTFLDVERRFPPKCYVEFSIEGLI